MHQPEPASGEVRREPADSRTARAIDRRGFLKTSAAISGGLLIQVLIAGGRGLARADTSSRGSLPEAGAKPAVLNAYIRIDPDGAIVLIMPKVEMGQGTFTSLPMLVAEELEISLDALSLEHAPPDPAVYGVEGDQSTGGSTSIRDCWLPLRKAGATARIMLIQAAAQRWGVAAASCHADRGEVIHAASGRRAGYGSLARVAAAMPVPAEPPLKPAKDFKLIGRPTHRRDTPDKTYGRTTFGIDVQVPAMRIAVIALAPVQGGEAVQPLNEAAAMAVPGVRQVVNDQGDVIAVVAEDTWAAMRGLKALQLRWHDGPNGSVQQSALVEALEAASRRPGAVASHAGNAVEAIKRAAKRVDAVYHQPFLAHATMEPMNCTVDW